jgi:hypothetical protein
VAHLHEIVIDCRHPAALAAFWAAVLDGSRVAPYDEAEIARLRSLGITDLDDDPSVRVEVVSGQPSLLFQRVPEGKHGKNRLHLDLRCSSFGTGASFDTERARVTGLGGTVLAEQGTFIVFADPEGNEFCLSRRPVPR